MGIAQFWSLENDLLTEEEGKRLFPLVAVGGTVGAVVGSQIAARGISALGLYGLMAVAAGAIVLCMALLALGYKAWTARPRAARAPDHDARRDVSAPPRDPRGGFSLLLRDRYLLLIGAVVILINLVNTTGDYIMAEVVSAHARASAADSLDAARAQHDFIGGFYGDFQTYVSVLTAVAQLFLVGRLFKWAGVGRALYVLPSLVLVGYGTAALIPLLVVLLVVKVAENSTEYSLHNTIQQALFLPTSRDVKYKAKTAIDTFLVRAGDLASSGLVFVGTQLDLGVRGFALANVAIGAGWIVLVTRLARRHRALSTLGEE